MKIIRIMAFCIAAACALGAQSASERVEIPDGVRYKAASDEVNAEAKTLLEKALAGDKAAWKQLFTGGPQTCGPMLWQELKPGADAKLVNAKPFTAVISTPVAVTTEGRALLTDEVRHLFWTTLIGKYPALATAKVRKASASEISYYWATIPFDIQEPLFALDTGTNVFIANLFRKNGTLNLLWIDLVGDLKSLKAQAPADKTMKGITDLMSDEAETQTPETMLRAGRAYLTGEGVAVDTEKGRKLLEGAAQKGVLGAQMFLGSAYFLGKYLPKDYAKAAPYLQMAAEQGNAVAQYYVGVMFFQGAGLEKSVDKAMPYLQKAADQNFAAAEYHLGAIYYQGIGRASDKAQGCALYAKAAGHENLQAINDLGWCYQQGEGMEKDAAKATALYAKAAEQGHPRGMGNLAMMYVASGDWEKAYIWLRIAENLGGSEARPAIENAKKHMTQGQIDLGELKVVEWEKAHPRKP